MADNSLELFYPPYLNNPRTCPKNMAAYQSDVLTDSQQTKTDHAKIKMARHNQKYLGAHPEIKAIVSLILRNLFVHRPANIYAFVGEFVKRDEFPDEIAQYLIENLKIPTQEDEEEEADIKLGESDVTTTDQESVATDIFKPGDHRFLKKMLYGVDPSGLRRDTLTSMFAQSYDQILQSMRLSQCQSTSTHFHMKGVESLAPDAYVNTMMSEEEDEEEVDVQLSSENDEEDNEEALLEGQRLIFAMLGKKMTLSPSTSDLSVSSLTGKQATKHAKFHRISTGADEDNQDAGHRQSARTSIFSEAEAIEMQNEVLDERDDDEEYFEKN